MLRETFQGEPLSRGLQLRRTHLRGKLESAGEGTSPRVLLMSMPWGCIHVPPLGLYLLKAVLEKESIPCDCIEAQLHLLRWIKRETYEDFSRRWAECDFAFTHVFEPKASEAQLELLAEVRRRMIHVETSPTALIRNFPLRELWPDSVEMEKWIGHELDRALRLRDEIVPEYLSALIDEIPFHKYDVVGFSCLFDQTIPSLSLAKLIRERFPNIFLIFGGYALQRPVGPHIQETWPHLVDVVAYGDGEPTISPLINALAGHGDMSKVPNISYLGHDGKIVSTDSVQIDLNMSPTPNYASAFEQRKRLLHEYAIDFPVEKLMIESSRGCWWGQKNHCLFCGIDDDSMRYRAKRPKMVLEQLAELKASFHEKGVRFYQFVDYIMPRDYHSSLLPELERQGAPYRLQYEMKPTIGEEEVAQLPRSGVWAAQLGIESFSTNVLRRMRKGVAAPNNVYLLHRFFSEDVFLFYNFLYGFPGDQPSDYEEMSRILPALYHLQPPEAVVYVRVTRYAPLSLRAEDFGLRGPLTHNWQYDLIFSKQYLEATRFDLSRYCYYFEDYVAQLFSDELVENYELLISQVRLWRHAFNLGARLVWSNRDDIFESEDGRENPTAPRICKWTQLHSDIRALAARKPIFLSNLSQHTQDWAATKKQIYEALDELLQERIMILCDGYLVDLAVDRKVYIQKEAKKEKWRRYAEENDSLRDKYLKAAVDNCSDKRTEARR